MIVHMLIEHTDHEGDNVLGVFSDHELAKKYGNSVAVILKDNYLMCHLVEINIPIERMYEKHRGEPVDHA